MSNSILIVDDDPVIRSLMCDILEAEGYDCATAVDGPAALMQIGEQTPDCVILDLMMPGMDGYTVLDQIRRNEETRTLPVLMLTAASDDANAWQAWSGGVDYFLGKPLEIDQLLRYLEYLFHGAVLSAER